MTTPRTFVSLWDGHFPGSLSPIGGVDGGGALAMGWVSDDSKRQMQWDIVDGLNPHCRVSSSSDSLPSCLCRNPFSPPKHSVGWFYGFTLHLGVNDRGEPLALPLTPANVDDRTPVPKGVKALLGQVFAEKGSRSQERFDLLFEPGIRRSPSPAKT
ncbi:hypothetical protein HYR99_30465 [Candidatus Poribacteria bacterium]|nr:hypothetical protein [Candidatus Poribacteria bacterium]